MILNCYEFYQENSGKIETKNHFRSHILVENLSEDQTQKDLATVAFLFELAIYEKKNIETSNVKSLFDRSASRVHSKMNVLDFQFILGHAVVGSLFYFLYDIIDSNN